MVAVTYYCPRCGALAALDRDAYLADKSVTPYPLDGWRYVSPDADYENDDVDGVEITCEECGRRFYLNFVKFQDGEAVVARPR